ncbi:MAG: DNA cytosine methyltransferase [Microcoleus sp. SM1_3_4]|nr:DNA cytosine methyltransferase [Microcoleus sp. SM1_3_4]
MSLSTIEHEIILSVGDTDISHKHLTCAEYFAGIGLVRLGLERSGWKIVFANDRAQDKFEMYSAYFQDADKHYKVQDIFSICHADIPNTLLATASFPCIDLSLAGNMNGISGQHSSAFWGFTQIIENQANRPHIVMLENVAGWLTSNSGQDFRIAIGELNRLGYACDVYAIDAAHFVPQSRPRIFAIGVRASTVNRNLSIFARRSSSLKTKALEKAVAANRDLDWNFVEVPPLPEKVTTDLSCVVENILDEDDRWWLHEEVQRHLNMMSPVNLNYLKKLQVLPFYSYCTMYRRMREGKQRAELRKDGIAGCLRTARGGSSRQMLVKVGQGTIRMRLMTPREYARLQGVPDNYPIPSQIDRALTGFGDAVCVPAIAWIAENILNPLVMSLPENTLALHY